MLLWCRLAAVAPMGLLAWEPPYAAGRALKSQKKKGGGIINLWYTVSEGQMRYLHVKFLEQCLAYVSCCYNNSCYYNNNIYYNYYCYPHWNLEIPEGGVGAVG